VAPRTVLISGCSTGIGRATAVRLARAGWDVFAGVRREEDGESVRAEAPERIRPVTLDVTDAATIEAAAAAVREATGTAGLGGLVNNAGVTVQGPLEFLPPDDLRRQLEVNVVGQIAVTQAVMPEIRAATGRIVNMGSVGGRVAHPMLGPYAASKFAIEALTDALRKELRPWGIHVVVVEPGSMATEIWSKGQRGAEQVRESIGERGRELYGDALDKIAAIAAKTGERGASPDKVAKVVERALTAGRPRTRYLVGADARAQVALDTLLPDRAFDAVEARFIESG
jgi:NAD(P)-dependent dehydrogenase (short-subunit alcohol dehydrogenase family)